MQKFRVWELSREFNKTENEIIEILQRHNIAANSRLSAVDESAKELLAKELKGGKEAPKAGEAKVRKVRRPVRTVRFDQQSGKPKEEYLTDGKGRRLEKPKAKETAPAVKPAAKKVATPHKETEKKEAHAPRPAKSTAEAPAKREHAKDAGKREHKPARQQDARPDRNVRRKPATKPVVDTPAFAEERPAKQNRKENNRDNPYQERNDERNRKNEKKAGRNNKKGKHQNREHGGKNKGTSLLAQSLRKEKNKNKSGNQDKAAAVVVTEVALPPSVTVKELAELFHKEVSDVMKRLMSLGVMATINQEVERDAIEYLADDYGITLTELPPEEDETIIPEIVDAPEDLLPRPPVVTIMGHVDHGKTSLLDTIRETNVTAREAGGITQHIGAYQIRVQGKKITFLDTPGHEAFTAMRARGAQVTDIAVLVVAADDGVMPQTIEAINHAKSAEVPIIVAINKMDKPDANPDHVKQQLAEHGLIPEEWGGDVIMVPVSAKKKMGIDDLLESILLVAEVLELKANPNRAATGVVIEGQLDKGRGPVVTVLIQQGTMRIGDGLLAGTAYGRVRAMNNEKGDAVKKAEPSTPVEILGLSEVPTAGELIYVMDEKDARSIAEKRIAKYKLEEQNRKQKVTLDDLFNQIREGELKNLNIIIKADVQGSVEALRQSFENIKHDEVRVDVVHAGVGAIAESDIMLASAVNALIIGFNVRPDANIRRIAETEQVDMRTYRVIYDAIDDVKMAMQGMLAPKFKEVVLGRAEVRQVIPTPKVIVAGSYVTEGKITNSADLRLIRDGIVIHEGKINSLRRFKDDVKEVAEGYECGISIESYRDVKEGDVLEAFTTEEIEQTLE